MSDNAMPDAVAITVFYDGACPVCAREIGVYQRQAGAEALRFVDVAACPEAALGGQLRREAALARLHVRLPDGRLLSGAPAFAALWRQMPRFALLGRVVGHRLVAPLAEAGYRCFLLLRRAWR